MNPGSLRNDSPGLSAEAAVPIPRRPAGRWRDRLRSVELLAAVVAGAILLRSIIVDLFDGPHASTFVTVFVSVAVAGLPFVVLGAIVVAAISAFVPRRLVAGPPGLPGLAQLLAPAATTSARRAALASGAFLLASPAASPVVLAATAVAFPGEPMMVLARLVAGIVTTLAMAGLWLAIARPARPVAADDGPAAGGWPAFWERCRVDVLRAGGVLVFGAFVVAALTVWLPAAWLDTIAGTGLFAVVAMALLAVLLSVRAGPDAFVAAGLSQLPATAQLAFLVVGPAANLRLFTRQVAAPGPQFALRFAPAALLAGVLASLIVGWVLL